MDYIFENNQKWVESTLAKDPETFSRLAKSQHPKYLYIGCSDSRVPAQNLMVSRSVRVRYWYASRKVQLPDGLIDANERRAGNLV